jgi:hypothetical protein
VEGDWLLGLSGQVSEYTSWSSFNYFSAIIRESLVQCGHSPDLVQVCSSCFTKGLGAGYKICIKSGDLSPSSTSARLLGFYSRSDQFFWKLTWKSTFSLLIRALVIRCRW